MRYSPTGRTLTQGMMCACGALNRVSVIIWLTMFRTTPEQRYKKVSMRRRPMASYRDLSLAAGWSGQGAAEKWLDDRKGQADALMSGGQR